MSRSEGDDTGFLQPVANHVGPIPKIDPGREGAAQPRHQLGAPALNMDIGGAASLVRRRSILTEVLGEIDEGLIDMEQCLDWSAFGVNHIVALELDVEELHFVALGLMAGDGRAI